MYAMSNVRRGRDYGHVLSLEESDTANRYHGSMIWGCSKFFVLDLLGVCSV
jgi:hypothetical protein